MPLPAYQRVANELRERIDAGTYPAGSKMPSLREVDEEFGVSRYISRAAYQVLVWEGRVEGRFGGGYYVRSFQPIVREGIGRLARAARDAGRSVWETDPGTAERELAVDSLTVATEVPPGDVASDLGLEDAGQVVVRRRRFVVEGKPVAWACSYYPADVAEGTQIAQEDTGPGGTYARLEDMGLSPARFREDVTARMPAPDESELLQIPPGTPVLVVRRVAWSGQRRAVEVNVILCDAPAYVLRYEWDAQ